MIVSRGHLLRRRAERPDSPSEEWGEIDSAVERNESWEMGDVMEGMPGVGCWR
jgi:hypothetical protein